MMQPFFIRTRATMIWLPTTNCRCNSGFRSSSTTEDQGRYFNSALAAAPFLAARGADLRATAFFLVDVTLRCLLAARFPFAMSLHPALRPDRLLKRSAA